MQINERANSFEEIFENMKKQSTVEQPFLGFSSKHFKCQYEAKPGVPIEDFNFTSLQMYAF
jgi:hypothetical protein